MRAAKYCHPRVVTDLFNRTTVGAAQPYNCGCCCRALCARMLFCALLVSVSFMWLSTVFVLVWVAVLAKDGAFALA